MIQSSLAPFSWGGDNLGVSLPWLISTLIVICIALSEEVDMIQRDKNVYLEYKDSAPFMLPVHRSLSRLFNAPVRLILKKEQPESRKEIVLTFGIYFLTLVFLSLPFLVLRWVPGQMLGAWPYNIWPFSNMRHI
jgi:hypothetical protein